VIDLEDLYAHLPHLRESEHRPTSQPADEYNCVAWVERDMEHWWAPGYHWPPGLPTPDGDRDLHCYIACFERWGFEVCEGPDLEEGYLRIALYALGDSFHHVAKQLPSGAWSSKIGVAHDLKHEKLEALCDTILFQRAVPTVFMRREYDGRNKMEMEETGLLLP
jgi:hypothetical protein